MPFTDARLTVEDMRRDTDFRFPRGFFDTLIDPDTTILDAFCCQGGAARGYLAAGFRRVIGVDRDDHWQRFPGDFILGDALLFIARYGHLFRFKHASPPCQGYSIATAGTLARFNHELLIPVVRSLFEETTDEGGVWVIENVELARSQMEDPIMLCGRHFGLSALDEDGAKLVLDRHRLFESNMLLVEPPHPQHEDVLVAGVYGGSRRAKKERGDTLATLAPKDRYEAKHVRKGGYVPRSRRVIEELLGLEPDVMTVKGMQECIPPVYAEYIGAQMLLYTI